MSRGRRFTRAGGRRASDLLATLGASLLAIFGAASGEARDVANAPPSEAVASSSEAVASSGQAIAASDGRPSVVLISMDGTRPADVTAETLPSLVALGAAGLVAEGLVTVDPSNTFPNHVSMATGVRPEEHRMVNNRFVDAERGLFDKQEPNTWIESEPIWSVAERHGVRSVSFYWVGSEGPWVGGPGPSETREFSSRTTERAKVDQILEWLAIPDPAERPRLITCWFHGGDSAGHRTGPGTPAVEKTLAVQDREIARLVRTMEARGLFAYTTLIFVSDHGMVSAERRVNLGRALGRAKLGARVIGVGGFSSVLFEPGRATPERIARAVEIARGEGLQAHAREAAPADWHVGDPRFGDVVVRAPLGTAIVGRTTLARGFHGYDSRLPEMDGLLVARGRGIEAGSRIGRVPNRAIAPTVLALLGLPAPESMREAPIPAMLRGLASRSTDDGDVEPVAEEAKR